MDAGSLVIAQYPWLADQANQLTLEAGKIYRVLKQTENGWAQGFDSNNREGFFPCSFVRLCTPEEVEQYCAQAQPVQQQLQQQQPAVEQKPVHIEASVPIQSSQTTSSEKPVVAEPVTKVKSSKHTKSGSVDSTGERKKKRDKKSGSKISSSSSSSKKSGVDSDRKRKRESTKAKDSNGPPSLQRRGTVTALQQFEKTQSSELSWSLEVLHGESTLKKSLFPSEIIQILVAKQENTQQIKTAIENNDIKSGKSALDQFEQTFESYEWNLFEWHSSLKNQWHTRSEQLNTELLTHQTSLVKLTKLQQARLFSPDTVDTEITQTLQQLGESSSSSSKSSRSSSNSSIVDQLDSAIMRTREKLTLKRQRVQYANRRTRFYDQVVSHTGIASCHFVLCKLFTAILAGTSLAENQNEPVFPRDNLNCRLTELIDDLLRALVTIDKVDTPLYTVLSKMVISWAVSNPFSDSYNFNATSRSAEFATDLAYSFVRSYRDQIMKLSMVGAVHFAEGIVVRMLSLVANGTIDITRPITEQLVALLELSVSPGHTKSSDTTTIIINTLPRMSVIIPSLLETAEYSTFQTESYSKIFRNTPASVITNPTTQWLESEIIIRSGWEVQTEQGAFQTLLFPKSNASPEFGVRLAFDFMSELLFELGWTTVDDDFFIPRKSTTSSSTASDSKNVPTSPAVNISELESQIAALQQQLQQQNQTIVQQNQLLQQEKEANGYQLAQLAAQVKELLSRPTVAQPTPVTSTPQDTSSTLPPRAFSASKFGPPPTVSAYQNAQRVASKNLSESQESSGDDDDFIQSDAIPKFSDKNDEVTTFGGSSEEEETSETATASE